MGFKPQDERQNDNGCLLLSRWQGALRSRKYVIVFYSTPSNRAWLIDSPYALAEAGEVFVWDMATLACVRRYKDEGALQITCMAMSPDGQYQAIGQDSGVVNIYKTSDPSFQTYVRAL